MSTPWNERGSDGFTLTDRSFCRWLDQQDAGWYELPDEQEFARIEYAPKRQRLLRIGRKLRSFLRKRRRYAHQTV